MNLTAGVCFDRKTCLFDDKFEKTDKQKERERETEKKHDRASDDATIHK